MQFPPLLSLSLSHSCCLSLHFTHIPGHLLLKWFNLKSCLAYFTSPTCFSFLYSVLCCCCEDVSLTLHGNACGYNGSVSIYLHTVWASSLFLNPLGRLSNSTREIKAYYFTAGRQESWVCCVLVCSLTSTCSPCDIKHRLPIKESSACMGF